MKAAVIQMSSGCEKSRNLDRAVALSERALNNGAKLVVLPEVFHYRGKITSIKALRQISETVNGPSLTPLRALAKRFKAGILAGSIYEQVKGRPKTYNTSVLIGPDGRQLAKYRKNNLFEASVGSVSICEPKRFYKGKGGAAGKLNGFTVGLSVCYDVRFPELYREYSRKGAHILCVPSAFTKATGMYHWEVLLRARAIENMCYVLAPNQCGKDNQGVVHYGNSMIIDPWGKILARASTDKEQVIYAHIDKAVFKKYMKVLPSIRKG